MYKRTFLNTIAATTIAASVVIPAKADTQFGIGFRYTLGGESSIGLFVRDVDFRDVDRSSTSITDSVISGNILFEGAGNPVVEAYGFIPAEFRHEVANIVGYDINSTLNSSTTAIFTENSDSILGYGLRVNFPLSKNWNKPAIELTGIYGKNDLFAQAGLGYDFIRNKFTFPVSAESNHLEFGTNLRRPLEDLYFGTNSSGNFDELSKTSTLTEISSELLCNPQTDLGYATYDFGNGKVFSGCVKK